MKSLEIQFMPQAGWPCPLVFGLVENEITVLPFKHRNRVMSLRPQPALKFGRAWPPARLSR